MEIRKPSLTEALEWATGVIAFFLALAMQPGTSVGALLRGSLGLLTIATGNPPTPSNISGAGEVVAFMAVIALGPLWIAIPDTMTLMLKIGQYTLSAFAGLFAAMLFRKIRIALQKL